MFIVLAADDDGEGGTVRYLEDISVLIPLTDPPELCEHATRL